MRKRKKKPQKTKSVVNTENKGKRKRAGTKDRKMRQKQDTL